LRRASPDRRVIILDGFAGRGRYTNGTPGSPVQMGQLADEVKTWKDPVDLRIFNIEMQPENFAELQASTEAWVTSGTITNYNTSFHKALPDVLSAAASSPLFAFLDPFRPKQLLFDEFKPLLTRTSITELLIVFHTPHVRRIIDQVRSPNTTEATRSGSIKRLNSIFGGDRWAKLLTDGPNSEGVVRCFVDELLLQSRILGKRLFICDTPIEARHGANLKYHIIFLTRHQDGVQLINDAFVKEKRDSFSQTTGQTGTLPFEELADPMDSHNRSVNVQKVVFGAAMQLTGDFWSFRSLLLEVLISNFGQFSVTEYTKATRELLERTIGNRFIGISGDQYKKGGKWKVNDDLILRLEK
jgi:three-Cys-motif partner protein